MKTISMSCFAVSLFAAAHVHAQESSRIDQIIQKRDSLLTQILEYKQKQLKTGGGTETDVRSASLELYSFRRDSAKTLSERLEWQRRIVASEKEHEESVKAGVAVGTQGPIDQLRAEERVLAAEQTLLELQSRK